MVVPCSPFSPFSTLGLVTSQCCVNVHALFLLKQACENLNYRRHDVVVEELVIRLSYVHCATQAGLQEPKL